MRYLVAAAAAALSLAACADVEDPSTVAMRWQRLELTGARTEQRWLLSRNDSVALTRAEAAQYAHDVYGSSADSTPGATVDSARVARLSGDSATVAVYSTTPDWGDGSGMFQMVDGQLVDRRRDTALVASLPRAARVDTVRLVRQRAGLFRHEWRFAGDVAYESRIRGPEDTMLGEDSSYAARRRAAEAYLAIAREAGRPVPAFYDSAAKSVIELAPYADSLRFFDVRLESSETAYGAPDGQYALEGDVRNISSRWLYTVQIEVTFSTGEQAVEYVDHVGPHNEGTLVDYGTWRGKVAGLRLKSFAFTPLPRNAVHDALQSLP